MSSTQEKRCRTCAHWGLDMICQNEDSGEQGYTCMAGAACGHWEGTGEPDVWHGQHDEDKPLTNGDRIRAMTDEELAEFIVSHAKFASDVCQFYDKTRVSRIITWLEQEVSPIDRLAAEYDRKHPNGLKLAYSLDGEVQQTEQEEKENERI